MTAAIDLTLDIRVEAEGWTDLGNIDDLARAGVLSALNGADLEGAFEVSLLATDNAEMARLNEAFRGKPSPTNVLSWPSEDLSSAVPGNRPTPPNTSELGDIAIGYEICRAEAEAAGLPLSQHVVHLLMHGTLHLLGYDHENEADAAVMEGIEKESLAKLGYHNPYS